MKKSTNRPHQIIGRNLARLRNAKGWTAEDLAQFSKVGISTIRDIERGVSEGSIKNRIKLTNSLKCSLYELYIDENEGPAISPGEMDLRDAMVLLSKLNLQGLRSILPTMRALVHTQKNHIAVSGNDL